MSATAILLGSNDTTAPLRRMIWYGANAVPVMAIGIPPVRSVVGLFMDGVAAWDGALASMVLFPLLWRVVARCERLPTGVLVCRCGRQQGALGVRWTSLQGRMRQKQKLHHTLHVVCGGTLTHYR